MTYNLKLGSAWQLAAMACKGLTCFLQAGNSSINGVMLCCILCCTRGSLHGSLAFSER